MLMSQVFISIANGGIMKKLIEVTQNSATAKTYSLREVFVNPEFVVSLTPDINTKRLLTEGRLPEGLSTQTEFTRVAIHKGATGQEMVVVGDISGFVASSFMRGINYYQVPTTLLAMVDSSIGGKTGLNFSRKKNIIGSIYQPVSVIVDPDLLDTLPFDEKVSGLGEIIKYGAINDRSFVNKLHEWVKDIESFPYIEAIERCCQIKAEIVTKDEKETDLRRVLNFGHTIGHALESYFGFQNLRHGEAVSFGMKCSTWISFKKGFIDKDEYNLLIETINQLPLPKLSKVNPDEIMHYINFDKKNENGKLNFVLLDGLGKAKVSQDVSSLEILESLKVLSEY